MRNSGWLNLYSIGGYRVSLEGEDPELRQLANAVYSAARVDSGTADIAYRLSRTDNPRNRLVLPEYRRCRDLPSAQSG